MNRYNHYNQYYNNYGWMNNRPDEEDYSAYSPESYMEPEENPEGEAWETFRQDRETRPGDAERASRRYMNERLVKTVQDCEASCEHMTVYVMTLPDARARSSQAALLRECADACNLTAKMLARNSMNARQAADLCARVCRNCGSECAKYSDAMSRQCSKICMECARECADFATM